jgi:hypothetical protein
MLIPNFKGLGLDSVETSMLTNVAKTALQSNTKKPMSHLTGGYL